MDTQHLQMILDTVKSIAGTAGTVGMVWIVIHYLTLIVQIIAWPLALSGAVFLVVRGWVAHTSKPSAPSGDMLEKTKQAEAAANAEIAKHICTQQLFQIAKAAGYEPSRYTGLSDRELNSVVSRMKPTAEGAGA